MEKQIFFEDWWSLGENCVYQILQGVLSDDKKIDDYFITSQEEFEKFKENIAESIYVKNELEKKYTLKKNLHDSFLGKKIDFSFNDKIVFVCTGAIIKEVLYSKIFQCYLIKFTEKKVEKSSYSAAVVNKYVIPKTDKPNIAYKYMNAKPEILITDRPKYENDEY